MWLPRSSPFSRADVRTVFGVQDFQDTATAITPIALTTPGTWYNLTNNGLGPLSSQAQAILGHGPLFNTSTNELDWSDLSVGDIMRLRTDVTFTTASPNVNVELRLNFGPGYVFGLPYHGATLKSASSLQVVRYFPFQIKTADVQANPARLQARSDTAGTTIVVTGWQLETQLL